MLKIKLRRSRILAVILVIAHSLWFAAIACVGIPLWLAMLIGIGLGANLVFSIRRHVLLMAPDSVVAIDAAPGPVISIEMRSSTWREYQVLGSTYVMPYLTVLQLRQADDGAATRVVLLPDSLPADDFRRLRVLLRWQESVRKS